MKDIFTIKNCKIVNEGDIFEGDVLVKEGRFLKIGSDIESQGETIDRAGGRAFAARSTSRAPPCAS